MKVATFLFEITSHSHFLAPKTSSGTTICILSFTGTWHDNLHPSFFSLLVKCDSSVGNIDPPPLTTLHLH